MLSVLMPSTEFLLYLVIVIFAVFVILTYYNKDPHHESPQYRYVQPDSYDMNDYDNNETMSRASKYSRSSANNQSRQNVRSNSIQDARRNDGQINHNISNSIQDARHNDRHNDRQFNHNRSNNYRSNNYIPNDSHHGEQHSFNRHYEPHHTSHPLRVDINSVNDFDDIPLPPPIDPLRKFDYDVINDDFTPPYRRSYYDDYDGILIPPLRPYYTRGPPGRFRKIGILVAEGVTPNDKYKFLNVMGRKRHPGASDYEYFASGVDSDAQIKFNIETKGRELKDGDVVKITELEGYTYKFTEHKDMSPLYDPYIM